MLNLTKSKKLFLIFINKKLFLIFINKKLFQKLFISFRGDINSGDMFEEIVSPSINNTNIVKFYNKKRLSDITMKLLEMNYIID